MKIIRCSENEFNMLINLINAGVRATGLQCVRDAAAITVVLESAETIPDVATPAGEI